jgi:DNA-binding SARP family transcriptional activator
MRVEIRLLGPFEFSVGDVSVVPTATKPCQLLAMLAINAGRVVSVSSLMEETWDHHPPRSAVATLHTYILHLRRRLQIACAETGDSSAKSIIVTKRNGYLLDVDPDTVDTVTYDRLAAQGRRAVNEGDYPTAAETLERALGLWRGGAFDDVPTGPLLAMEAMRLAENRLSDLELRIDAQLRLGHHHQLLGELAVLCASHPTLENFTAQFMLALYRSGRQWRALQVFRELRRKTVEQLGVEPSPRLRELHQLILAGDPVVDDPNFVSSTWVPSPHLVERASARSLAAVQK